ncbi:hypothetical protein AWC24_06135 [Mycolicibacter senuensis]|nr:hypothetical protein AWC24_06135 [Mycolicibacter senuensis]
MCSMTRLRRMYIDLLLDQGVGRIVSPRHRLVQREHGDSRTGFPPPTAWNVIFADYQFGHGLPVITVPWAALTDVLAPDMAVLAQR